MLDVRCEEDLAKARAFADHIGQREQFEEMIRYLEYYGDSDRNRLTLFSDFAPYSFTFTIERRGRDGEWSHLLSGGLIYHGPHDRGGDGGGPTHAVTMNPTTGWSIHT